MDNPPKIPIPTEKMELIDEIKKDRNPFYPYHIVGDTYSAGYYDFLVIL